MHKIDTPEETVRLGLMPPLTGLVGIYGTEISRAGQIACREVNENGGVLGRPLELVIEDDGSLPGTAVAAAEKLVGQQRCSAIIGNLLSNSRIAVAYRVAEPHKVPYLNFSFYEGSILSRYFFHFAALPNQQIDRMIPYMHERYGPRMFFAGNNYEWPRGSIHAAKIALERTGGEIVGEEYCPIGVNSESIERLLDHLEATAPDVFVPYFAGDDQVSLLTRFTERGLKNNMAVVMGHYDEIMASHLSPEVREGFYSSNTYFMSIDSTENRNYLARLAELPDVSGIWPQGNGILTNFGEGTYACVKAFAKAANEAGSLDPEALIQALETINISTPQGTVQMNPEHHHAKVSTCLSRCLASGEFKIIEQFGAIEPVLPEHYRHQRITHQATLEDDIRLQARMLEQMSEAVFLVNFHDGNIIYSNAGAERMFGYGNDEMVGLPIARLNDASENDPAGISADFIGILKQKGEWRGEIHSIKKDGNPIWCSATVTTFTHPVYGEVWLAVYRDITVQKQAEQALQHERDFATRLLNTAPVIVLLLDTQGYIKYVNPYFENLSGYRLDEVSGQEWFSTFLPARDRERIREIFKNSTNDSPTRGNVNPILTRSGEEREIEWYDQVMRDDNNNITGVLAIGQDVTERKYSELSLRQNEAQLAEAQAIGHMGNWNWDIQNKALHWSDEIYRIFGLHPQPGGASYEAFINGIHPDDREPVQTAIDKALYEMQPYSIDHRILLPDGSIRFVHEQGEVRFDENGEPLRMIGTVQDISERKLTEQALRKSETRFRATFEQAAVGVAHVGTDGRWLRVNDRLCEIIGYTRPELLKSTFQDITHPDDLQTDLALVKKLIAGLIEHYSLEKRYLCKDGSITWIQLTVALVRNSNNQPDYFISVVEDINNRKAAEARILATLNEKDTVLRELHHRVKNNMQVISSLLSLQARYVGNKDPQLALQESRQRIRTMALIHERLYGNDDLAAVNFLDYLRYLGERLARLYYEAGVTFKIQVSGEPLRLPVDHALPCALICNELITNAIRHAYPAGQRERLIEIRITDTDSGRPQVVVRDYGRGIDQGKVSGEPTSLGLVIIRALTRQLGGVIHFESTQGTIARLIFPLVASEIAINNSITKAAETTL